jgi:endonuclease/exonuclease/phosphatase family metal-dependent hydrolase
MKTKQSYPAPASRDWLTAPRRSTALHLAVCVLFSAAVFTSVSLAAQPRDGGGKRDLAVSSHNVYVGALIEDAIALDPTDTNYPVNLVLTVTRIYHDIAVSDPAKRMAAIAAEIADRKPDLVGLQELSKVFRQSPGDLLAGGTTPATEVVYDYLQLLRDALEARGARYEVAAVATEIDVEMPMLNLVTGGIDDARLVDHEAILVRADLPPGYLRVGNAQSGNFTNVIVVPGIGLEVKRGWCSVDVFTRGCTFRFICAHLETEAAPILQNLQAEELLSGPANVAMPVMMVGDFNTDPLQRDDTTSYGQLVGAGFTDAWNVLNPQDPAGGLTFGHDSDLAAPTLNFVWRLDLTLYRGACFQPTSFTILDPPFAGPQPPLWPSDHAGIHAEFRIR